MFRNSPMGPPTSWVPPYLPPSLDPPLLALLLGLIHCHWVCCGWAQPTMLWFSHWPLCSTLIIWGILHCGIHLHSCSSHCHWVGFTHAGPAATVIIIITICSVHTGLWLVGPISLNRGEGLLIGLMCEVGGGRGKVVVGEGEKMNQISTVMHLMFNSNSALPQR